MAYSTGTTTSPVNLLAAIKTFLEAGGWTTDKYYADGTGYALIVHKGGLYFTLRAATAEDISDNAGDLVTGLALSGHTGFDTGLAWNRQPGYAKRTDSANAITMTLRDVPLSTFTYHLISGTSPDAVFVAVEYSPGMYRHLYFGSLDKAGAYTGGMIFSASEPDYYAQLRQPVMFTDYNDYYGIQAGGMVYASAIDAITGWAQITKYIAATVPSGRRAETLSFSTITDGISRTHLERVLYGVTPNAFNGVTPLFPIPILLDRGSGLFSPMGNVHLVRYMNMANHAPGDVITIGSDQWLVLPAWQKGSATTGNIGYAVLKNAA